MNKLLAGVQNQRKLDFEKNIPNKGNATVIQGNKGRESCKSKFV